MDLQTIVLIVFFASYCLAHFTGDRIFAVVAAVAAGVEAILLLLGGAR